MIGFVQKVRIGGATRVLYVQIAHHIGIDDLFSIGRPNRRPRARVKSDFRADVPRQVEYRDLGRTRPAGRVCEVLAITRKGNFRISSGVTHGALRFPFTIQPRELLSRKLCIRISLCQTTGSGCGEVTVERGRKDGGTNLPPGAGDAPGIQPSGFREVVVGLHLRLLQLPDQPDQNHGSHKRDNNGTSQTRS